MNRMVRLTAFASALALASLIAPPFAVAKDKVMRPCIECVPGGGGGPDVQNGQDEDFSGGRPKKFKQPNAQLDNDPYIPRKRVKKSAPNDQFQQGGGDDGIPKRTRGTKHAWKFNPNQHERRRYKDKRFHIYFDGHWYPRAYWDDYYYGDYIVPYRLSCREGAEIVSERFNRVRILECNGRVYTYLGRRHGDTFEIKLNARSGRIIDAQEI